MKKSNDRRFSPDDYTAEVYRREDGDFVALSPEFPGAGGSGVTREEAIAELIETIDFIMEDVSDEELPIPRHRRQYSGLLSLRLGKNLHRLVAQRAQRNDESINSYIKSVVEQSFVAQQQTQRLQVSQPSVNDVANLSAAIVRTWLKAQGVQAKSLGDQSSNDNNKVLQFPGVAS